MNYFFRYCLGATAALYMFDMTKKSSLEKITNWITETDKCNIPLRVLVGNKLDVFENTSKGIDKNEALALAKSHNIEYFEVASIGEGSVEELFNYMFSTLKNQIPNPPKPEFLLGKNIVLGKKLLSSNKYQLALCDLSTMYE